MNPPCPECGGDSALVTIEGGVVVYECVECMAEFAEKLDGGAS